MGCEDSYGGCEMISPRSLGASGSLNLHPERKGYALFPSFKFVYFVEVLALGVGSSTCGALLNHERIYVWTNSDALKKRDWRRAPSFRFWVSYLHPSELWNFLLPYFLLWVIVIFGFAQKSRL